MNELPFPRKRFGQHFLHDLNILQKIIDVVAPDDGDHFVEIGPGRGALTALLLAHPIQLDAIEIDRDLVTHLQKTYASDKNFSVHSADVLEFNFASLIQNNEKLRVIGNLPYNISTPLLFKLFAQLPLISDMYFMLQKEVVLRLTAPVGDPVYGRLSVMAQYFCDCELLFNVSANSFSPPPKVESAFVRLIPHASLMPTNLETLSTVVREAFNYRRKTLANALKRFITAEQLKTLNINPQSRPQELTVADFVKISNIM